MTAATFPQSPSRVSLLPPVRHVDVSGRAALPVCGVRTGSCLSRAPASGAHSQNSTLKKCVFPSEYCKFLTDFPTVGFLPRTPPALLAGLSGFLPAVLGPLLAEGPAALTPGRSFSRRGSGLTRRLSSSDFNRLV